MRLSERMRFPVVASVYKSAPLGDELGVDRVLDEVDHHGLVRCVDRERDLLEDLIHVLQRRHVAGDEHLPRVAV